MKAYNKDSRRMFKNNLGRFISIVLIIMLGSAFFVGMNEVSPVMKQTAEKHMKDNYIYDYNLFSNLGYNDENIDKFSEIDGVKEVQGVFSYDALTSFGEKDITVRAVSRDEKDTINLNDIIEGRNIENENECLICSRLKDMYEYEIGQTIKLYRKDDTKIENYLTGTDFKIVGIVRNPIFLSKFYGNTTLLTGELNGFIVVNKDVFKSKDYTSVYVKADIDDDISRFADKYEEENEKIIEKIEKINDSIAKEKYDDIYSRASKVIDNKEKQIIEAEELLNNKNAEIRNSQLQVNNTIVSISSAIAQSYATQSIYDNAVNKEQRISKLYTELGSLENNRYELENQYNDLKTKKEAFEKSIENIENKIERNLYELYSLDNEASRYVSLNKDNYKLYFEYNRINGEYQDIKNRFEQKNQELDNVKEKIDNTKDTINTLQKELYSLIDGEKYLIEGIGNVELNKAYYGVQSAKEQIEEAIDTINRENIEEKLIDAKEEIIKYKNELNKFEAVSETMPLYKNSGFKSLKEDLSKIAIMGRLFPVMFFVIAGLVTITTISRMIEVDRKNIGTLKALGYQKEVIISRYVRYAFLAGITGTILGCILGSLVIVEILFVSYSSLYDLPNLVTRVKFEYILMTFGISLASTVLIAWIVTKKELKENAAELMRPKVETTGKSILLEKIPFIWNRLDFLYKICFRNIFRYKKRLFMTLIGIAGCTALIYSGLGLQKSINEIENKQFKDIRALSMEVYLSEDLKEDELQEIEEHILNQQYVESVNPIRQQSLTVKAKDNEKDVFYIVSAKDKIDDYIKLKNRKSKEKIELNDDGVVLTEKLAQILDVSVGEKVDIIDDDIKSTIEVIGITENYLYNYIYFTPSVYERIYGKEVEYNELFANTAEIDNEDDEIKLSDDIKENNYVLSVVFNKNLEKEFKTSLASLMSIVILFLACASLLSFTVLINLNNINIEERKRELSTIKLLGFYQKELESYVFRENIILTILGTALGLIIGMGILGIIIQAAEVETIFLVKDINYIAMIISVVITLMFTLITNFVMKKKIKNIDMVESLKSIE